MPIRWSAVKVMEAADRIEQLINQAAGPLEEARAVAREARKIPNLPLYVDQDFTRIIGEIDRAIGGSQWEPVGRLRSGIEAVRKSIPSQALEDDKTRLKHGSQQSLIS